MSVHSKTTTISSQLSGAQGVRRKAVSIGSLNTEAPKLIHAMLEQPGFAGALGVQQLNGILKALEALVADADATVRTAAAKTFWGVHTRFPSDADAMLAKLDASRQKAVGRHKP